MQPCDLLLAEMALQPAGLVDTYQGCPHLGTISDPDLKSPTNPAERVKRRDRLFRRMFAPMATFIAISCVVSEGTHLLWIDAPWWWHHSTVAAIGTGGMLAAFILADTISRNIARPLRELVKFAERTGQGESGPHIHINEASELSVLARAFNRMSDRLAAQISQIDEERDQLRAILDGMVEGVLALDGEQRVLFANDRALALLDLSTTRRPEGRRLWEMVRQRPLIDAVTQAMMGPDPVRRELEWPGTTARSLTVHAARLPFSPEGQSRGAVVVLHDTSELRRLERLRQDFVANVSHELKTPLSVIKICAETLKDGAMDDLVERGRFIDQVIQQSERLSYLIVDLLSLARIESGDEIMTPQAVPLQRAMATCRERLRERADARRQTIELNGTDKVCEAWVDEEALTQILDNLVDNAVKYTPEGGLILISWNAEEETVQFSVRDNGIGIPAQDLLRIFERFYRVDKARSRELGGTGLGLAIVKHMVQSQRGTITATSEIGKGTCFTITLPRA